MREYVMNFAKRQKGAPNPCNRGGEMNKERPTNPMEIRQAEELPA